MATKVRTYRAIEDANDKKLEEMPEDDAREVLGTIVDTLFGVHGLKDDATGVRDILYASGFRDVFE